MRLTDQFLLLVLAARLGQGLPELHTHAVQALQHPLFPLRLNLPQHVEISITQEFLDALASQEMALLLTDSLTF